ncbi:MAG: hypothetical protein M1833_007321 [Piccolia ochrophora]|nr:MAG: hypothetical protein M1833_007321 [Piccolia ochrophora]
MASTMSEASGKACPCTFPQCMATFDSERLLKNHKINNPDHVYCKICDLDFVDDDMLLIHKIESEKHITCIVCSEDFRSMGGRDLHYEQMHSAKQNIKCIGCGEVFIRAGGLMNHVEKNQCSKITPDKFRTLRARKEIVRAFLRDPEAFNEKLNANSPLSPNGIPWSHVDSSGSRASSGTGGAGGVPLPAREPSLLDDAPSEAESGTLSVAQEEPPASKVWPKLESVAYKEGSQDDHLTGLASLTLKEPTSNWGAETSKILFPNAPSTPASGTGISVSSDVEGGLPGEKTHPWDPDSKTFRPMEFLHPITGRFCCPHPNCSAALKSIDAFKAHLKSPAHLPDSIRCPSCLRLFKSTTALVQHCESSSSRCDIRYSDGFNQALDTITGGLLETKGFHDDGTIRYEAAEPTW